MLDQQRALRSLHVVAGEGPAITVVDAAGRGIMAPRPVLRWLRDSAEKATIPYQLQAGQSGSTDATAIYISKTGVPCSVVSVPARYIHSHVSIIDRRDYDKTVRLLVALVKGLDKRTVSRF